ncbi:MAG: 3-isopropylmalate dehydratase large subunit [Methanomassiliicoccales archaeon]|jgi:3-isopropylmalate/(R)-2-methylmalate dehydratase large subunit
MGTVSEEILSAHVGKEVTAGDITIVPVDFIMGQDGTTSLTIQAFRKMEGKTIRNPGKFAFVIDHNSPSPLESISNIHSMIREFSVEHDAILYDIGEGVCHQLMPEKGHVLPGGVVIGADSHTCTYGALNSFATGVGSTDLAAALISGKTWMKVPGTIKIKYNGSLQPCVFSKDVALHMVGGLTANGATYKALEIEGEVVDSLSVEARMTISNMAVETGAKVGIMRCDDKVKEYLEGRTTAPYGGVDASEDAKYDRIVEEDLSDLPPQVSRPHDVDNVAPIDKVAGTEIDEVFIGTCTNGRFEDFAIAAKILAGKQVSKKVRLIVAPASRDIMLRCIEEGILAKLIRAGAAIVTSGCGPCVGTCGGVPADGEVVLSTANRNFKGRMGNSKASIYLASPATAAYSAMSGVISDPREVLG